MQVIHCGCKSYIVDVSVFLSAGSRCFRSYLDFYPLYHHLLLLLISSIFLVPSLRAVLFTLYGFFLILSYCPLLLHIFHIFTNVQKSFLEFSNFSWSCKNIKFNPNFVWVSFSFPNKALLCRSFSFLSALNVINFSLMCLVSHTSFLPVVVHIHIHILCDLESQELSIGTSHTLCSKRLSIWICAKAYLHALHSSS